MKFVKDKFKMKPYFFRGISGKMIPPLKELTTKRKPWFRRKDNPMIRSDYGKSKQTFLVLLSVFFFGT